MSVDDFNSRKKAGAHQNDELCKKLLKVADYMEKQGILTRHELKAVRKAASVAHGLFSTNTLNAYVHNATLHPRPNELKLTWDEMEAFIKKLWE